MKININETLFSVLEGIAKSRRISVDELSEELIALGIKIQSDNKKYMRGRK